MTAKSTTHVLIVDDDHRIRAMLARIRAVTRRLGAASINGERPGERSTTALYDFAGWQLNASRRTLTCRPVEARRAFANLIDNGCKFGSHVG